MQWAAFSRKSQSGWRNGYEMMQSLKARLIKRNPGRMRLCYYLQLQIVTLTRTQHTLSSCQTPTSSLPPLFSTASQAGVQQNAIFQRALLFLFKKKKSIGVSSVQFSHSVVSDSLWPHEPQHARPPCPSPTPRVHPNSCPLSQWCHPTILSSVIPFSSLPQSFPASGSSQMSQLYLKCCVSFYCTAK